MPSIRVLLADDHARFRRGVASLLAAESDFEVVGEAADGQQALDMARDSLRHPAEGRPGRGPGSPVRVADGEVY
jgi:CheY-like chemotaxis protein